MSWILLLGDSVNFLHGCSQVPPAWAPCCRAQAWGLRLQVAGLRPGSIHMCLVPAGLQGPPVCGAHGPGLLPAEQPSLLQAVPCEAECCGVLLRAPLGWGLWLHTSPACQDPFPNLCPFPTCSGMLSFQATRRDQLAAPPITSAAEPRPPPSSEHPSDSQRFLLSSGHQKAFVL